MRFDCPRSAEELQAAGGTRARGEGHRGRHGQLWNGRRRRHIYELLDRNHHRPTERPPYPPPPPDGGGSPPPWRSLPRLKPGSLLFFLQTVHEGRIYQLKLFCGDGYPDDPPSVRFQTRINMACVDQETGAVGSRDCAVLGFPPPPPPLNLGRSFFFRA